MAIFNVVSTILFLGWLFLTAFLLWKILNQNIERITSLEKTLASVVNESIDNNKKTIEMLRTLLVEKNTSDSGDHV